MTKITLRNTVFILSILLFRARTQSVPLCVCIKNAKTLELGLNVKKILPILTMAVRNGHMSIIFGNYPLVKQIADIQMTKF